MDVHQFVIEPRCPPLGIAVWSPRCPPEAYRIAMFVIIHNHGNEFEIEGEEVATKTCARLLDWVVLRNPGFRTLR